MGGGKERDCSEGEEEGKGSQVGGREGEGVASATHLVREFFGCSLRQTVR